MREIDARVDRLEEIPIKMDLMTKSFNRLSGIVLASVGTIVSTAAIIILVGRA